MSLSRRILVNGLLAAVPLALVGYLLSQGAGVYVAAQDSREATLESSQAIADKLTSRLPFVLALGGFLFVAVGEVVTSLWRRPRPALKK